jgi:hypothetical protein
MMSDFYEINVMGHLDIEWSGWFEGLTIARDDQNETMLSGQVSDQAAFYGILARMHDMSLFLITVKHMMSESV